MSFVFSRSSLSLFSRTVPTTFAIHACTSASAAQRSQILFSSPPLILHILNHLRSWRAVRSTAKPHVCVCHESAPPLISGRTSDRLSAGLLFSQPTSSKAACAFPPPPPLSRPMPALPHRPPPPPALPSRSALPAPPVLAASPSSVLPLFPQPSCVWHCFFVVSADVAMSSTEAAESEWQGLGRRRWK